MDLWPCYTPTRTNQQWYTHTADHGNARRTSKVGEDGSSGVWLRSAFDDQCLTVGSSSPSPTPPPPPSGGAVIPFAMVCGRISSYDSCQRGPSVCAAPHGYCLQLGVDGAWKLLFASELIASGNIPPHDAPAAVSAGAAAGARAAPEPHRLEIRFAGEFLHCTIDNRSITPPITAAAAGGHGLGAVGATNSSGGMIAIGSGFHTAFFDDLTITA